MKASGLSELHAVVAVAAHRSFRAAATSLGVSASAVSHAITALEDRLGVRLFSRTTRSVSLTQAGESFLAKVQPALRDIADAMETVNRFREQPTGTLRLNTSEMAARQLLAPLILNYAALYPDVGIDVVTEGRLVDIVALGFDAGIRIHESLPLDMVAVPIGGAQRHIVVGSPAYLADHPKPRAPNDLSKHACLRLRLPGGNLYKWEFERRGQKITVDVPGQLTFDNANLTLEAALRGAGLAYVYAWAAREALAHGELIQVLGDWTPPYAGLHLYYPRHRHPTAALRTFIDFARTPAASV